MLPDRLGFFDKMEGEIIAMVSNARLVAVIESSAPLEVSHTEHTISIW
jgi:hypothetical protein